MLRKSDSVGSKRAENTTVLVPSPLSSTRSSPT